MGGDGWVKSEARMMIHEINMNYFSSNENSSQLA